MYSALLAFMVSVEVPKPRVTSLALFKNGFAVVTREAVLPSTNSLIANLPASTLGTLWIAGKDGVLVKEIVNEAVADQSKENVQSIEELLAANVGKQVTIKQDDKVWTGELVSASGSVVMLKNGGTINALPKSLITGVEGTALQVQKDRTQTSRALRIKTNKPGIVVVVSLERGATWAPSYAVDVTDPKTLRITGKATILNDLDDFVNVEARLVTGFPNVPYAGTPDPLTSGWSVDQFVGMLGNMAGLPAMSGQMMQNQMADRRNVGDAMFVSPDVPTSQVEDLFMFKQAGVTLKKGERGAYVLFTAESPYENVYTWDIEDSIEGMNYRGLIEGPGDVWNTLKFKNTSPIPFTTAPATTFKNGEMLGQDLIKYTSVGAEAFLKITKALELRAEASEEEVSRILRDPGTPGARTATITLKGTLSISNRKAESVHMRITKNLTGEVLSTDDSPEVTKPARGLREANPRAVLVWNIDIPARTIKKIGYSYKVIVGN